MYRDSSYKLNYFGREKKSFKVKIEKLTSFNFSKISCKFINFKLKI